MSDSWVKFPAFQNLPFQRVELFLQMKVSRPKRAIPKTMFIDCWIFFWGSIMLNTKKHRTPWIFSTQMERLRQCCEVILCRSSDRKKVYNGNWIEKRSCTQIRFWQPWKVNATPHKLLLLLIIINWSSLPISNSNPNVGITICCWKFKENNSVKKRTVKK